MVCVRLAGLRGTCLAMLLNLIRVVLKLVLWTMARVLLVAGVAGCVRF